MFVRQDLGSRESSQASSWFTTEVQRRKNNGGPWIERFTGLLLLFEKDASNPLTFAGNRMYTLFMVADVGDQVQESRMYTNYEAQQIAKTIGQQIGGLGRVASMIGAYNFSSHKEGALSFRFKAKALQIDGKSPNYIKITLDPSDLYTVTFGRIHGMNYTELQTFPETYCDQLQGLLEDVTGLVFTMHAPVRFC